jgi:hypothetical protein
MDTVLILTEITTSFDKLKYLDKMVGIKSMFSSALVSSQRPKTELAAARTEQREFKVVVIPALAMEMVWKYYKNMLTRLF